MNQTKSSLMKRIRFSGVLLVILMSTIGVLWVLELLSTEMAYDLAFKSLAVMVIYICASLAITAIIGDRKNDTSSSEK